MKNLLLIIVLLFPFLLAAQHTEGTITYTETVKMRVQVDDNGPDAEEMRKMLPPTQSFNQVLYFNEKASLYREPNEKDPSEDVDVQHEEEGRNMRVVMKRPQSRIYRDLEKNQIIQSQEFFGRFFLISGEATPKTWKLTGERKKILDYDCQKAILQDTSRVVEAWFTTQIPAAIGPGEFADLPGLILAIEVDHGNRSVVATKVNWTTLPKDIIEKPTKGKSVTREEYKKMVDEKMKEMGGEGGGGNMRVIIRN